MTAATVTVSGDDEVAVARVSGEVDMSNVRSVHRDLLDASTSGALVVDLDEVRYLDSAAVSMLFDLSRQLRDRRRVLGFVVGSGSPLLRLFHITDLATLAPVEPSVDECVRVLKTRAAEL